MITSKNRYYTDNEGTYYDRCRTSHKETGQRCVICLKKSQTTHHAAYGNDVPGVTIFAVCKTCHNNICHDPKNWLPHRDKMLSCNTPAFTKYLQRQYLFTKTVHNSLHGELKYTKKPRK
jgi:hypothetical protein